MEAASTFFVDCADCHCIAADGSLCHVELVACRRWVVHSFGLILEPPEDGEECESKDRRTEEHCIAKYDILGIVACSACNRSMWIRRLLPSRDRHMVSIERRDNESGSVDPDQIVELKLPQYRRYHDRLPTSAAISITLILPSNLGNLYRPSMPNLKSSDNQY